jgi:uncharacterized protein YbcC (UPF0753/DUF2309 family)
VEAPREAINDILARHPGVGALFDNRWLHLFALNEEGLMQWRYSGGLRWTSEKRILHARDRAEPSVAMASAQ